jgi:DNA-binding response OmpR family regulator
LRYQEFLIKLGKLLTIINFKVGCSKLDNILIIEDEEKVSEIIKAYLEKEGYSVYCATKGMEGIKIFEKIEFSLVILDLMLPGYSTILL